MTPVRLESAALRSRVKHSTTEPLGSLFFESDTVKMIVLYRFLRSNEIFKDIIQTVGLPFLFYCFVMEILKKL